MNAQTKHTAGPWEVQGNNIVATKGNVDVAVICYSGEHFTGEDKANARLIAAAPELLDALRWIVDSYLPDGTVAAQTVENARAAIAKAVTP